MSDNVDLNRAFAHKKGGYHGRREDHRVERRIAEEFRRRHSRRNQWASKTIHGIKSAWVKEQHVVVDNGKAVLFRVDMKVTFVLDR